MSLDETLISGSKIWDAVECLFICLRTCRLKEPLAGRFDHQIQQSCVTWNITDHICCLLLNHCKTKYMPFICASNGQSGVRTYL